MVVLDGRFSQQHQQQWLANSLSVSKHRAFFQRQYTDDTKNPNDVLLMSWAGFLHLVFSDEALASEKVPQTVPLTS